MAKPRWVTIIEMWVQGSIEPDRKRWGDQKKIYFCDWQGWGKGKASEARDSHAQIKVLPKA